MAITENFLDNNINIKCLFLISDTDLETFGAMFTCKKEFFLRVIKSRRAVFPALVLFSLTLKLNESSC